MKLACPKAVSAGQTIPEVVHRRHTKPLTAPAVSLTAQRGRAKRRASFLPCGGLIQIKSIATFVVALLIAEVVLAGVWGDGSFENDDARDWVSDLIESDSIEPVAAAFDAALRPDYIKTAQGSAAVAAAEVVAAALGRPSRTLPPELQTWLQRQSVEQLRQLAPTARKALARVLDPRVSQLRQIWSGGRANEWLKRIADLDARLAE